jgi:transcriptional regulator with XRE-family HTH domain
MGLISDNEAVDNISRTFPVVEIVKIRKCLGWTVERLSKESGVSVSTIKRIERGSAPIVSVTASIHAALIRGINKIEIDIKEYSQTLLNSVTSRKGWPMTREQRLTGEQVKIYRRAYFGPLEGEEPITARDMEAADELQILFGAAILDELHDFLKDKLVKA